MSTNNTVNDEKLGELPCHREFQISEYTFFMVDFNKINQSPPDYRYTFYYNDERFGATPTIDEGKELLEIAAEYWDERKQILRNIYNEEVWEAKNLD